MNNYTTLASFVDSPVVQHLGGGGLAHQAPANFAYAYIIIISSMH